MIVDMRTRIWAGRDPLLHAWGASGAALGRSEPETTSAAHQQATDVADVVVVTGWRSDRLGVHAPMEQVQAAVHDQPDRRVGFAPIDPSAESALDDIEAARAAGMVGLTMSPADQGVRPTDDRFLAALERAAARRMPVLVANPCLHAAQSVLEFARPALLDEAARQIPGLTLCLGDLGHAWLDEALVMVAKHERVYAEISGVVGRPWSLYTTLLSAHERGVTGRLLFASGFPAETPERAIERLYTVNACRGGPTMPAIPREIVRGIIERDALAALGIEHDFTGAGRGGAGRAAGRRSSTTPLRAER